MCTCSGQAQGAAAEQQFDLPAAAAARLRFRPCVQAPAAQKLPVLYLLDSVSKMVGEPYKTLFAPSLREVGGWAGGQCALPFVPSACTRLVAAGLEGAGCC